MSRELALTLVQTRIVLSFLRSKREYMNTEGILNEVGIALSTWSEEQNRLLAMGLIQKIPARVMASNKIVRVMNYKLSPKGHAVALNLANISRILSGVPADAARLREEELVSSDDSANVEKKVRECIEIGLDGFGMNFMKLVKTNLELESNVPWEKIATSPRAFEAALHNLFGREGAKTIELMIMANLRSQFPDLLAGRNEHADLTAMIQGIVAASPMRITGPRKLNSDMSASV